LEAEIKHEIRQKKLVEELDNVLWALEGLEE